MNIWIIIVVIISSLIKGLTGFGFALVSLPFLLLWYAPKEIIPVLMICNLVASLFIVIQKKEKKLISKDSFLLIGAGGIFTLAGVFILKSVNGNILVHIAGIFFIVLTLLSMLNKKPGKAKLPDYSYPLVGAIIGLITGIISVSGPPLALFLNRAKVTNREFREIFAWFSVVTAITACVGYIQTGMLTLQTFKTTLIFTPILLLGTVTGKYFNSRISVCGFRRLNIILTLISCLLLLIYK